MNQPQITKFAFFGSSNLSITVLNELKKASLLPSIIVTTGDKPQGRKLVMTPNVVKQWAIDNEIPYFAPAKLDEQFISALKRDSDLSGVQLFVVASYGRIIPKAVLAIPTKGTLNIHPSLLPKYRGPSPLPSAMLDDEKHTGVSIMLVDDEMDHGPVVSQKIVDVKEWPTYEEFESMMAIQGAQLLAETIPAFVNGTLKPIQQEHSKATYTKKIAKEDGLLDMSENADQYLNFRKIQAYHEWPQAYFFIDRAGKQIRIKVTKASFANEKLTIEKVIPEGGKEMNYNDFLRGIK